MRRKSFFSAVVASFFFVLATSAVYAVLPTEAPVDKTASAGALEKAKPRHHKPGELLVKFKAGTRAIRANAAIRSKGHGIAEAKRFKAFKHERKKLKYPEARMDRWWRVKLAEGEDLDKAMAKLAADPAVEYVEPNYQFQVQLTPNDPLFGNLWGMHNIQQSGGLLDADIDAPEAWDIQTGSPGIVVAVIDTGVDYNHEDLAANMWTNPGEIPGNGIDDDANGYVDDVYGYDFVNNDADPFDDHGHGTHCSGTVAGVGNNGIGVAGVSWNARIMALKFLGAGGSGSTSDAIDAIVYATNNGARIMSNSWGGGPFSQALLDAINAASDAGVLFVAAAGNYTRDNDVNPFYPATYNTPNMVSVAATDHNDDKASFSHWGAQTVHLGAPGVNVQSTVPTGSCSLCSNSGYTYLNGTSMATPHVSGAAALVLAKNPALSMADLKATLLSSVDLIPALAGITVTGGRLNVASALNFNLDFEITLSPTSQGVLAGESATYTVTVTSNSDTEQQVTLSLGSLDPGISATLTDTTLTLPALGTASTTLTATADVSVPRGSYAVPINGADGSGQTISGAIALLRVLVPEYNMSIDPSLRIIGNGDSTTYNVTLTSVDGYSGAVTLSTTSPDPLITLGLSPSVVTVPADGSVTATLSAATVASIPSQTYTLTVDASDGSISKTATTQLRILDTDLVMTSVTSSVTEIGTSVSFTVDSVLANQGAEATETQTYVGYYLSTDSVITADDTLIGTETVAAVAGNATVNLSSTVTVPTNLPEGAYYVGAIADHTNLQPETDETNNALAVATPIQVIHDVDLVPTSIATPGGDVYTGSSITLTAGIANQGGSTNVGSTLVRYYLSTDAEITTADIYVGYGYAPTLVGGATWDDSRTLNISTGIAPGTYYVGMIVDPYDYHQETDEANNALAAVNQINVIHEVDLVATSIATPGGDVYTGSSITLTAGIANQGGSTVAGSSYVRYYLSSDAEITTADIYVGYGYAPTLVGGATWDDSRTLNISTGIAPGTYYVGMIVDPYDSHSETDETNNALAAVNQINVIHEVDLVATSIATPGGDVYTGSSITLTAGIANQGGSTVAGSSYVRYYLSSDAEITTADTYLGYGFAPTLLSGGTWDDSQSLNISTGIAPGTYYVGMIVDPYDSHSETDETNNALAAVNQINVIHEVDLVATSIATPGGDVYTGSSITLTASIANQGQSTAAGWTTVRYYLSSDAEITTADTYLGYGNAPPLVGSGTWDDSQTLNISTGIAPGTYYVGMIVDPYDSHSETDETNNALAAVNQINVIHEVDLVATSIATPGGDVYTGSSITLTASIANQGQSTAAGWTTVRYYLSSDAEITTADTYLGYGNAPTLAGGGTWDDSRTLNISTGIAPGTYYVGMIVDPYDSHSETDETNNALAAVNQINVIHDVDLVATALATPGGDVYTGSSITLTASIANQGQSTAAGSTTVRYYLSSDAEITTADTYLGYGYTSSLVAGGTWDDSRALNISAGIAPGTYYVGMIVDPFDYHSETDETNNALAAVNQINVIHEVDLVATSIATPGGDVYTGSSITLTASIANQGQSTAAGSTTVRYYLSSDAEITTADTYLGYGYTSSLVAGGTWDDSRALNISAGIAPGTYYVGMIVDPFDYHSETDETNNALAAVNQINVIHEVDLVATAIATPGGDVYTGSSITLTASIANQGGSAVGASYVRYYLSSDAEITAADTYLGYAYASGLVSGGTWDDSRALNISTGIAPGTYYVGMIVDPYDSHSETDETNNALASVNQINVIHEVDLVATSIATPGGGDIYAGSSFTLTAGVANQGGSTSTGSTIVRYYLSSDAEITTADTYLGYGFAPTLLSGGTWDDSRTLNISAGTAPGAYYVGMIVDPYDAKAETDETNNTLATPVNILQ